MDAKPIDEPTGVEAAAMRYMRELFERERGEELADPAFLDAMAKDMAARQRLGIAKYGTTLANNIAPLDHRMSHAYEEALDLIAYLHWAGLHPQFPEQHLEGLGRLKLAAAGISMALALWIHPQPYGSPEAAQS